MARMTDEDLEEFANSHPGDLKKSDLKRLVSEVRRARASAAAPEKRLAVQRDALFWALRGHLIWYEGGPGGRGIDEHKLIRETRAALELAETDVRLGEAEEAE